MTFNKKQLHDLKSALKRRERRPESSHEPQVPLTLSARERDRVTQSCSGVLLKVESMIVATWKRFPEMDDLDTEQALVSAIRKRGISEEGVVQTLVQGLEELRVYWSDLDVSERDWTMALRAILGSVRTHSSGQKGSQNYLAFTVGFLADAERRLRAGD